MCVWQQRSNVFGCNGLCLWLLGGRGPLSRAFIVDVSRSVVIAWQVPRSDLIGTVRPPMSPQTANSTQ